mmetsp:Transcript_5637/g.11273  ORF Transcript_5637/g.11273 Transcript_5637/m.11273 type:complete len:84 (-) Transcript_5637:329-580(-)
MCCSSARLTLQPPALDHSQFPTQTKTSTHIIRVVSQEPEDHHLSIRGWASFLIESYTVSRRVFRMLEFSPRYLMTTTTRRRID